MAENYLDLKQVVALGPWPEGTWRFWRHTKRGPKAALVGKRLVYRESEVRAWIEQQFDDAESTGTETQEPA